jgi:protein gp37
MGAQSQIEWTDATWNPIRGCTRVSEGCRHCYAERVAARFSQPGQPYHGIAKGRGTSAKWTGKVVLAPRQLEDPLRWRRPRRIFVNSMSDLFHENLDVETIASILAIAVVARHTRGHTFQILTKRAARMRGILTSPRLWTLVHELADPHLKRENAGLAGDRLPQLGPTKPPGGIMFGVSVEDQPTADERIPHLLATPAWRRFVSAEPLLGPVDFDQLPYDGPSGRGIVDALRGHVWLPGAGSVSSQTLRNALPRLNWVISGGESGPGARPAPPPAARGIRDQCEAAKVPFFWKQWGAWAPAPWKVFRTESDESDDAYKRRAEATGATHAFMHSTNYLHRLQHAPWSIERQDDEPTHATGMRRHTKAEAGNLLDGRTHQEMPDVA